MSFFFLNRWWIRLEGQQWAHLWSVQLWPVVLFYCSKSTWQKRKMICGPHWEPTGLHPGLCVYECQTISASTYSFTLLLLNLTSLISARTSVCLFQHTHLFSWMGGSLRPMIQLASCWKIPSSCSTKRMQSEKAGRHKTYRNQLSLQRRATGKALVKCKPADT